MEMQTTDLTHRLIPSFASPCLASHIRGCTRQSGSEPGVGRRLDYRGEDSWDEFEGRKGCPLSALNFYRPVSEKYLRE